MRSTPALLLLAGCSRGCAVGTTEPGHQITVGVRPSSDARPELAGIEASDAEMEALADTLIDEVAPGVVDALGYPADEVALSRGPTGEAGDSAVALQIRLSATDAEATRVAAAFALVLEADGVTVLDWTAADGAVAWGGVRFLEGAPSEAQASALQGWLMTCNTALQGWYTSYGDTVYLLEQPGEPDSGLDSDATGFQEALEQAVEAYADDAVVLDARGQLDAVPRFNDWSTDSQGEAYLEIIGDDPALLELLEASNNEAQDIVDDALGLSEP